MRRDAVMTSSPDLRAAARVSGMSADTIVISAGPVAGESGAGVVLSRREYAELVRELETVRTAHRTDLAGRLRDVRTYGVTSDSDELLAVVEESAVDVARIARLEGARALRRRRG
jgi:hypothetical protein